jgi:hypothetical protein
MTQGPSPPTIGNRRKLLAAALVVLLVAAVALTVVRSPVGKHLRGLKTVADRLDEYGPAARGRLEPAFARAGVRYPPASVILLALKRERRLEVYAEGPAGGYKPICSYPILAASGHLGPKLAEGDYQVPEGVYAVDSLNPNSEFHLALRVGYPNAFDRQHARSDGRTNLGGNIMIHGGAKSVGCIAVGDRTAEDLFVLVADTSAARTSIVISPIDFRTTPADLQVRNGPRWLPQLYAAIRARLRDLPPA